MCRRALLQGRFETKKAKICSMKRQDRMFVHKARAFCRRNFFIRICEKFRGHFLLITSFTVQRPILKLEYRCWPLKEYSDNAGSIIRSDDH